MRTVAVIVICVVFMGGVLLLSIGALLDTAIDRHHEAQQSEKAKK